MPNAKPQPEPKSPPSSSSARPGEANPKPGEANPITQLAILVAILVGVLNAGFFFLSNVYFDDRAKRFGTAELARIGETRLDFLIFTIVVGAAAVVAAMFPRHVSHGIAVLAGIGSKLAAIAAVKAGLPNTLGATLLVAAVLIDVLVWRSLRKSRAAWSSLASLCLVYGIVMLFAAPKMRGMFDVGLWQALIVPGLLGVATAAFRMIRSDYREQS